MDYISIKKWSIFFGLQFKRPMNELENYYSLLQNPNGANINEISNSILNIYSDPNSIFLILSILSSKNEFNRHQASIGLQKVISLHWEFLQQTMKLEDIKSQILKFLVNEENKNIRIYIIYTIEKILRKDNQWGEIFNLLQDLLNSKSQVHQQIALNLITIMIPSFSDEEINNFLPEIDNRICMALQSNDIDFYISGIDLFAQLLHRINYENVELIKDFSAIVVKIFNIFHQSLVEESNISYKISNRISSIISGNDNYLINVSDLLIHLLEMANDKSINPSLHYSIFSPISDIIERNIEEVEQNLDILMKSIINSIRLNFADECFQENSTASCVSSLIDQLCQQLNCDELFLKISDLLSDETPELTFASIITLDKFIYTAPNTTISQSYIFSKFFINHLSSQNHHSIREVALIALQRYINFMSIGLNDFFPKICEGCILAIQSDDPELILQGLKTLTTAITSIEFDEKFINPIYKILISILQSNSMFMEEAVLALSKLLEVAEDDLIPYFQEIIQYLYQATQIEDNISPILKGESIEALARIISISPYETDSIVQSYFQILMKYIMRTIKISSETDISTSDTIDSSITSHISKALTILVSSKFPIHEILPNIAQYAFIELDCGHAFSKLKNDDFKPEQDETLFIIESICNAIKLVNSIILNYPELLAEEIDQIMNQMKTFVLYYPSPAIIKKAFKTIISIICTYGIDPNQHIYDISSMFDTFEITSLEQIFYFFTKLFIKRIPLKEDIYSLIFSKSLSAIKCENTDTEQFTSEDGEGQYALFVMTVYECLGELASNAPEYFDKSKFIQTVQKFQKSKRINDVILSTDVLGRIYESNPSGISGLYLKFLIKIIIDSLQFCDGNNQPFPIISLRRIIDANNQILSNHLNTIVQQMDKIMNLENNGQAYYHQTIASSISFILSLARIQGEQFPYQSYLPTIISLLPEKYESQNIYSSIILIYQQLPDVFNELISQLIIIFAKILSLKDSSLKTYNFEQETYQSMILFTKQLFEKFPETQNIISQTFEQNSLNRLNQHIFG